LTLTFVISLDRLISIYFPIRLALKNNFKYTF
jgi:hypothetical protein